MTFAGRCAPVSPRYRCRSGSRARNRPRQAGTTQGYDQHAYQNEKRQCLELWEARLLSIVEPRPGDITDLAEAREFRATEVYSSSARLG